MTTLLTRVALVALLAVAVAACGDDGGGGGGGRVEGTITVEGEPLDGATVELHAVEAGSDETDVAAVEDSEPVATGETDGDGAYALEGVEDGDYTVLTDIGDIPAAPSCIVLNTAEVRDGGPVTVDVDVPVGYQPLGPISLLLDGGILACG